MLSFFVRLLIFGAGLAVSAVLLLKDHQAAALFVVILVLLIALRDWLAFFARRAGARLAAASRADLACLGSLGAVAYATWQGITALAVGGVALFFILLLRRELGNVARKWFSPPQPDGPPAMGILLVLLVAILATVTAQQLIAVVALLVFSVLLYGRLLTKALREAASDGGGGEAPGNARSDEEQGPVAEAGQVGVTLERTADGEIARRVITNRAWSDILVSGLRVEDVGLLLSVAENGGVTAREDMADSVAALRRRGLVIETSPEDGHPPQLTVTQMGQALAQFVTRSEVVPVEHLASPASAGPSSL